MAGRWRELMRVRRDSGVLWAATLAADRLVGFGLRRWWQPCLVPAPRLAAQIDAVLRAWGTAPEDAAVIVEKILYADLRGIDSHGVCMLPFYQRLRDEGRMNPAAKISIVHESDATALIDGGRGLGHVPATFAMTHAIAKARATGVGVVAVRNSGHFGAAGAYAAMAAQQGLLALVTTNTPTPSVVPTFGHEALLGTNPIALAAPAARHPPFLLDMATSAASLGSLLERWRRGRPIPRGWALDPDGHPTTDGAVAAEARRLLPLGGNREHGGHKGYGLAAAVEILSTLLPGVALNDGPGRIGAEIGHFMLVLDPARFRSDGSFAADLDRLIERMHGAPPRRPERPVLVPGDPEQRILAERSRAGIPLTRSVFEDVRAVAIAAGVPFVLEPRR